MPLPQDPVEVLPAPDDFERWQQDECTRASARYLECLFLRERDSLEGAAMSQDDNHPRVYSIAMRMELIREILSDLHGRSVS